MKLLTFETGREERMQFEYYYNELLRCKRRCGHIIGDMYFDAMEQGHISSIDFGRLHSANEEMKENQNKCDNLEWQKKLRDMEQWTKN